MKARGCRVAAGQCVANQAQPCGGHAGDSADRVELAFGFVKPVQQPEHMAAQEGIGGRQRLQPAQLRRSLVCFGQLAGFQRVDRQLAPGGGQARLQRDGLSQRGGAGAALAARAQQLAQLQMQRRIARASRQRAAADLLGGGRVAATQGLLDFLG